MPASISDVDAIMRRKGAQAIIFKLLANNDNSKQQVYLGSCFSLLRDIPLSNIYSDGYSEKHGARFKASLPSSWVDLEGNDAPAPNNQIVLYPKYPEVRMSGMIRGCPLAPSHLLQPPSRSDRAHRNANNLQRCLILGLKQDEVLMYLSEFGDAIALEAAQLIDSSQVRPYTSVFFENIRPVSKSNKQILLEELEAIYRMGPVQASRLDRSGNRIPYEAQNSAGLTLESYFGITPNGVPGPDYLDWELKTHKRSAVTMMTPAPDSGTYRDGVEEFMHSYATAKRDDRMDFATQHKAHQINRRSNLTMKLNGYDREAGEIIDPAGGLLLVDQSGSIAAGWTFSGMINHFRKKHENTCFVKYSSQTAGSTYHQFGPKIRLCQRPNVKNYLNALDNNYLVYDPGIKMTLKDGVWKPKERHQFRTSWKNVFRFFDSTEDIILD